MNYIDELQISIGNTHDELNNTWFTPAEISPGSEQQSQSQSQRRGVGLTITLRNKTVLNKLD